MLVYEKVERTVEKLVSWVERQVAPSLAVMKEYYREGFEKLVNCMVIVGESRLREKHIAMIRYASEDAVSFNFGCNVNGG